MKSCLKNFNKSLQVLKKTDPSLAHQLEFIDPSELEFCWTQEKELNLKRIYEGKTYYYHSSFSARKEAQDWFQSLDLHLANISVRDFLLTIIILSYLPIRFLKKRKFFILNLCLCFSQIFHLFSKFFDDSQ